MQLDELPLHPSWQTALKDEFKQPYMQDLQHFLLAEIKKGKSIFPSEHQVFQAFNSTPLDRVKLVILGQDPYHGRGQAIGLAFAVPNGIKIPPSLRNIFKELQDDVGITLPSSGNLLPWAQEGVLLLNTVLTVEEGKAAAHRKKGWEQFTDATIQVLSEQRTHLVFMLWGKHAQSKEELIEHSKHLVLKAAHPSPLARGAFFGSKHFSKANAYLQEHEISTIDWKLI